MSSPTFSSYYLRRWSTAVRLRDDYTCAVCGERFKHGRNAVQAHHVKAKSVHPDMAYDLDNGISVCAVDHQPLVHTTRTSWKNWVPMFRRFNRLKYRREWNERMQHKIRRGR